jgi:hypothetical protein
VTCGTNGRFPDSGAGGDVPRPGVCRLVLFGAILLSQAAMPIVLLLNGVSSRWPVNKGVGALWAFWITLWAVFSVWVSLDADSLCRIVEPRSDPLGAKTLGLSLLGIANVVSVLLFLISSRGA